MPRSGLRRVKPRLHRLVRTKLSRARAIGGAGVVSRLRFTGPGGASRDRTGDLLLAKQALSQLSYGPVTGGSG